MAKVRAAHSTRQPIGSHRAPRVSRAESPTEIAAELGEVVYFVDVDGLVKIGHTADLASRIRFYGGWTHLLAVQRGTRADERALHQQFAAHLARGREYFHPHPDLLRHIASLRQDSAA